MERIFSLCGHLTVSRRNRMTKSLEMRVFIKLNADIAELSYLTNVNKQPCWLKLLYCLKVKTHKSLDCADADNLKRNLQVSLCRMCLFLGN